MADRGSQTYGRVPGRRSAPLRLGVALGSLLLLLLTSMPVSAAPNSLPLRATYDVSAFISWADNALVVSSTASVRNTTDSSIERLSFHLLPLRVGRLQLGAVTVGQQGVKAVVSDQNLTVPLPQPLRPGERVSVTINYTASFNTRAGGKRWLFLKMDQIVTAYRWIPWLSRAQPFKTPNIGESWVTAVSNKVTVRLTSDISLKFATSGRRTGVNGQIQTFVANDVRDFNFTASPSYKVKRGSWNGIAVKVYYRDRAPAPLVDWTIRALKRFSNKIGPYPYDKLTVAETPTGSGMESPALIWVSSTVRGADLPYIVVHETAHQWFYAVVGNNQAKHPYLDEALADFLTRDLLSSFRSSHCDKARLDRSVYEYSASCYVEVIYVQGGRYLNSYRHDVGGPAFWSGLSQFYRDHRFGLAGTRRLLEYLDSAAGATAERHEERFPSIYPV